MNAMTLPLMTLEQYLAWENEQPERHEFHRGEVFAMVGARRIHGRVVHNLARELGVQLKGSPCQVFSEGMKVQVGENTVLYPDLFVTCDRADLATDMIFKSPLVVVEVSSPSSAVYDRGAKFALYRRIPALREYVLIDPDTRRVEAFRRNDAGDWLFHDMSEVPALDVPGIGCRVALADVFDGIDGQAAV